MANLSLSQLGFNLLEDFQHWLHDLIPALPESHSEMEVEAIASIEIDQAHLEQTAASLLGLEQWLTSGMDAVDWAIQSERLFGTLQPLDDPGSLPARESGVQGNRSSGQPIPSTHAPNSRDIASDDISRTADDTIQRTIQGNSSVPLHPEFSGVRSLQSSFSGGAIASSLIPETPLPNSQTAPTLPDRSTDPIIAVPFPPPGAISQSSNPDFASASPPRTIDPNPILTVPNETKEDGGETPRVFSKPQPAQFIQASVLDETTPGVYRSTPISTHRIASLFSGNASEVLEFDAQSEENSGEPSSLFAPQVASHQSSQMLESGAIAPTPHSPTTKSLQNGSSSHSTQGLTALAHLLQNQALSSAQFSNLGEDEEAMANHSALSSSDDSERGVASLHGESDPGLAKVWDAEARPLRSPELPLQFSPAPDQPPQTMAAPIRSSSSTSFPLDGLSPELDELALDTILSAVERQVNREYIRFYGSMNG